MILKMIIKKILKMILKMIIKKILKMILKKIIKKILKMSLKMSLVRKSNKDCKNDRQLDNTKAFIIQQQESTAEAVKQLISRLNSKKIEILTKGDNLFKNPK